MRGVWLSQKHELVCSAIFPSFCPLSSSVGPAGCAGISAPIQILHAYTILVIALFQTTTHHTCKPTQTNIIITQYGPHSHSLDPRSPNLLATSSPPSAINRVASGTSRQPISSSVTAKPGLHDGPCMRDAGASFAVCIACLGSNRSSATRKGTSGGRGRTKVWGT